MQTDLVTDAYGTKIPQWRSSDESGGADGDLDRSGLGSPIRQGRGHRFGVLDVPINDRAGFNCFDRVALEAQTIPALEAEFDARERALRADYESKLSELKATYPQAVARRLAEGLIRSANGRTVNDIVATSLAMPVTATTPAR